MTPDGLRTVRLAAAVGDVGSVSRFHRSRHVKPGVPDSTGPQRSWSNTPDMDLDLLGVHRDNS